ncbi:hypothetical protein [Phyllobacterium sp. K27]
MKIRWKPTCIAKIVRPDDFYAYVYGVGIGRIYKATMSDRKNVWSWGFVVGHPPFSRNGNGYELGQQAAADRIEEWYKLYITTPPDQGGGMGLEPEEYPPDASSQNLGWLKKNKPDAFWKRIEDIRAGRVDRNYNRWIHDKTPLEALTEEDYV